MIPRVPLHSLVKFVSGGTPSRANESFFTGNIPWISSNDIVQFRTAKARHFITEAAIAKSSVNLVPKGTVLFVTRVGVGKVSIADIALCFSQDITGLICDTQKVVPEYLARFLTTLSKKMKLGQRGSTIQGITRAQFQDELVPLPSLEQQQRIAAVLERLDATRRQRREAANLTEEFLRASFFERFGDPVENPKNWQTSPLSDVSSVSSGITKGRNLAQYATTQRPYLRVANVQDGRLALNEIKFIELKESECEKFELKYGDVLLTEGGDPDKLGRGTVWRNEIEGCVHQNHIFKVRVNPELVNPFYLSMLVGSAYGKRYFLRAAKQTTGIATINSTQLKAFPVLVPPLAEQEAFAATVATVEKLRAQQLQSTATLEALFQSTIYRAFSGEELFKAAQCPVLAKTALHTIVLPQWRIQAGLTALLMEAHAHTEHQKKMGRVKIEKTNHFVETAFGIDLGRIPRREPAGPADFAHLLDVEDRADALGFYRAYRRSDLAQAYEYRPGPQFATLLAEIKAYFGDRLPAIQQFIQAVLPLTKAEIECAATAYAAWNDLLQAGQPAPDAAIVRDCRQNWTPNKASYSADEFHTALRWLRAHQLVPTGQAKRTVPVPTQGSLFQ